MMLTPEERENRAFFHLVTKEEWEAIKFEIRHNCIMYNMFPKKDYTEGYLTGFLRSLKHMGIQIELLYSDATQEGPLRITGFILGGVHYGLD